MIILLILFKSFVLDIIKVLPEYEKRLKKSYKKILDDEESGDLISSFYENIEDISKELSENDFKVFEKDPVVLDNVNLLKLFGIQIHLK